MAAISEVLPTLAARSDLTELLGSVGLTSAQPASDLLSTGEVAWNTFVAIGELLVDICPGVALYECLPTLSLDSDADIPVEGLSAHLGNRLRGGGATTWQDLGPHSPADLSRRLSIYQRTLVRLVALCVQRALVMAAAISDSGASDVPLAGVKPDNATRRTGTSSEIELITRWAQTVSTATQIGDVLTLSLAQPMPDDVAAAYESLAGLPFSVLTPHHGTEEFGSAYQRLLTRCGDDRDRKILRERLSLQPSTLEELGQTLGLTRERVRQVQVAAGRRLAEAAASQDCAEVRWRAQRLRHQLGASIQLSGQEAQAAIAEQLAGLPAEERDFATSILLWLAGPYQLDSQTGWIHAGPVTAAGPPAQMGFLQDVANEGRIDAELLSNILAESGLVQAAQADWLKAEHRIREVNGALFLWTGTVADKAATALEAVGQPTTVEEINAIIGEGHNLRGVRGRLLSDDRFIRTDRVRIGLREWGLEEYSGIVDEIAEEIERAGGEADADALITTVAQRFDLRSASVESYAGVPRFVLADGRIRLRRPDEPYLPFRTIFDEPGCYVLDDSACVIRLSIDRDTLRGSGRPLPQGLGAWLGVLPGSRRGFHLAEGSSVLVTWPDSALLGPSLGTIRRGVLEVGGAEGDQVRLMFDRTSDRAEIALVRRDDLVASTGVDRLTHLTGVKPATSESLSDAVARAIGVTPTRLRSKLRERGESDLLELLPRVDDPELEAALDQLKAVL